MKDDTLIIDSVPLFLAHALAMEDESAEHYEILADTMEVHHNHEVAALFRKLMGFSEKHADEVRAMARGIELPAIAPWEFSWNCPDAPETGDCLSDAVHYQMTPQQALTIAMHNETQGRDFYAWVAEGSPDNEVRLLARDMAAEEQLHVDLLLAWSERGDVSDEQAPEDLDPPNIPE